MTGQALVIILVFVVFLFPVFFLSCALMCRVFSSSLSLCDFPSFQCFSVLFPHLSLFPSSLHLHLVPSLVVVYTLLCISPMLFPEPVPESSSVSPWYVLLLFLALCFCFIELHLPLSVETLF